jgi:cell division inhibitor SepF
VFVVTRGYDPADMGLGDVWNRTLVYFGIAEDEEWDDEELTTTSEELERDYRRRERANVRRLPKRREADAWADGDSVSEPETEPPPRASSSRRSRLRGVDSSGSQVRVHLVLPRSFNDAQQIADRFKDSVPVILNLQSADTELSKRLIDFASGLTYALDGSMQRVADKVFLLTPRNVEVSAEERARALDPAGGFFNQA